MSGKKDFSIKKTICWDCENACGRCSWSREFKPVDGWEVTPSKVYQYDNLYADSYVVHKCPMFKRDTGACIKKITLEELGGILECHPRRISDMSDGCLRMKCQGKGIKIKILYTQSHNRMIYIVKSFEKPNKQKPIYISKEVLKLFFGKQKGYTGF